MNIIDIFVIACAIITGTVSITGGKKQAGLAFKGLFYLVASIIFMLLLAIVLYIHAAFATCLVVGVIFIITFIAAYIDIEEEQQKVNELREKLEKSKEEAKVSYCDIHGKIGGSL